MFIECILNCGWRILACFKIELLNNVELLNPHPVHKGCGEMIVNGFLGQEIEILFSLMIKQCRGN